MKLISLDLKAFGPFTDVSLDLSKGDAGFHIIYGANEAGKSSTLRAIDSLFFGIPTRTSDNFRHDNAQLRIGGTFEDVSGKLLSVIRRKGTKSTLLDSDGAAIDDGILGAILSGMDQKSFLRLFGINHDTLKAGGEELLQLGGEVGQSLFAASLGGVSIREMLASLDSEADELFKPRGQTQKINSLIKLYEEKRDMIRKLSLSGTEWVQQQKKVTNLEQDEQDLLKDITVLSSVKAKLVRMKNLLPDLTAHRIYIDKQVELGDVFILPDDMMEKLRDIQNNIRITSEIVTRADGDINALNEKLEMVSVPDVLLNEDAVITELHQRLGNYMKSQHDGVKLAAQQAQFENEIKQSINDFPFSVDLKKLTTLTISRPQRALLRELTEKYQKISTLKSRAEDETAKSERKLARVKVDVDALPAVVSCQSLQDALTRARIHGDLDGKLQQNETAYSVASKETQRVISRLTGWKGTFEDAEVLIVPTEETVLHYAGLFRKAEDVIAGLKLRYDKLEEDRKDIVLQIEEMERIGEVPTETDLLKAREYRENGWRIIRGKWINGDKVDIKSAGFDELTLPDIYESAVSDADKTADRLRREADRVAQKGNLLARQERCIRDIADLQIEIENSIDNSKKLQDEWIEKWKPANVSPLTPDEMRPWLVKLQQALTSISAMRTAEQEVESAKMKQSIVQNEIWHELEMMNEQQQIGDESYGALLDRAQAIVVKYTEAASQRIKAESLMRETAEQLDDMKADAAKLQIDLDKWQIAWSNALIPLQLPESSSSTEVELFLDALAVLHEKQKESNGLAERINGIERDANEFSRDVESLAARLAQPLANRTYQQVLNEIYDQLLQAREDAATRKGCLTQIADQKENRRKAIESTILLEKELNELCGSAKCDSADLLIIAINKSREATQLQERLDALSTSIYRLGDGKTVSELENEASGVDPDSIPSQLAEVENELLDKTNQRESMRQQLWEAQAKLREMDGTSQAAEAAVEAQKLLAEMRLPVEHYMKLRLTIVLLKDAIEKYRTQNQSPLLSRTGSLFAHLTLNSYQSVTIDFDDNDTQVIKGVRNDGRAVDIAGMSDGTRDQLYLALRIASIERYLAANSPMPFIVDDILVTFDDARATAALELLAELSNKTQVIFFTHHHRLVELAEKMKKPEVVFVQSI